jgi:hypothetical protein
LCTRSLGATKFVILGCRCVAGRCVKHFWEHGAWRDRHLRACVLLPVGRTFGSRLDFCMRRLDHCSQRQYNRSNLDRTSKRWPQILEELGLLKTESCTHVETVCCTLSFGRISRSSTILGCRCPTCRDVCQTVLATLWEHGGLERPSSARARVSCPVGHFGRFGFWYVGVSTIAQRQYGQTFR